LCKPLLLLIFLEQGGLSPQDPAGSITTNMQKQQALEIHVRNFALSAGADRFVLRRSGFHTRHMGAIAVGIGIPTHLLRTYPCSLALTIRGNVLGKGRLVGAKSRSYILDGFSLAMESNLVRGLQEN